jgi:hypothetical protein
MSTAVATEKLAGEVPALRERIRALRVERAELTEAPIDKRTALERIDAHLAYLAGEARVNVGAYVSREASHARDLIAPAQVGESGHVGFAPVLAFLAWYSADVIRAKLVADVEAYYAARDGVDDVALAERLAAIDAELLALETDEERAIMALEAAGVRSVMRRSDADPRALVAACS